MKDKSKFSYLVTPLMKPDMGKLNVVYISQTSELKSLKDSFIVLNDVPFVYKFDERVSSSKIALNNSQRDFLEVKLNMNLINVVFETKSSFSCLDQVNISLDLMNAGLRSVDTDILALQFLEMYDGFPFTDSQVFYFVTEELTFKSVVTLIDLKCINDSENLQNKNKYDQSGIITNKTKVFFTSISPRLTLTASNSSLINNSPLLQPDFSFEDLGIGGLKTEFSTMFRRAFVQRVFDSGVIKKLGIPHVKGILLHGPPGTGKTLIARQIGSLLDARPPKIVNGPEILNKYVGQSEENVRNLFLDAENEYKQKGNKSSLHIIIFDELDAIFKTRSNSSSTNIGDQVVNQLLSKMDGVEALDNILVIGMTNRPDLIDSALLRPGRFEIHIEITLPSEEGRLEIFRIHTKEMNKNGYLGNEVDLKILAKKTRNYTGAEICAVVKCAASYALERKVHSSRENEKNFTTDNENLEKNCINRIEKNKEMGIDHKNNKLVADAKDINITFADFIAALNEVKPSFGCDEDMLQKYIEKFVSIKSHVSIIEKIKKYAERLRVLSLKEENNEIFDMENNKKSRYNEKLDNFENLIINAKIQPKVSPVKSLSFLLYGRTGSGKTTLAIKSALATSFPFIKIISPINVVGMCEGERIVYIKNVFEDAYRSEESVVILDDIPTLIDYVSIGPRFLNGVLQAIKIFIKNISYKGNSRVLVIGTGSNVNVLHEMGVVECFSCVEEIPLVSYEEYQDALMGKEPKSYKGEKMTIKNIITMIENDV